MAVPLSDALAGASESSAGQTASLIVDDLAEKLLVFRTILDELGHEIVCARSGSEALKEVLRREFAVILLKYTDDGGTIELALTLPPEGQAMVTVSDNGIGMDADLLPNVFELFEQGKRSLDRSQGGLGVG